MSHQSPKRAAIYARSATAQSQPGENRLYWQVDFCRRYCDGRGYAHDERHIYQEIASGADYRNRPHLHALLLAASRHEFDLVVVHVHDRLARNPVHVATLLEVLSTLDIEVECPTESSDAGDHFLHLMHTFLVEQARECFHRRVRQHGNAPSHLVTNDEAASLIQSLFDCAADEGDLPTLTASLNTNEHPALGGTQRDNTVPLGERWERQTTDSQFLER